MTTNDSSWNMTSSQAQNYMINPLLAPEPADETGLNANFRSTFAPKPPSAHSSATHVNEASHESTTTPNKRHSRGPPPNSSPIGTTTRSRGNSLTQRYPGDMTHRPLDMLKHDTKTAHRQLRKASIPGVDSIDSLDTTPGGRYHHEGPFDATLAARNVNAKYSPVAAVAESNREALKATPVENIKDAVERHRPLDGVATVPPGMEDRYGRRYEYQETNVMTEDGGDYKKWNRDPLMNDPQTVHERDQAHTRGSPTHGEPSAIELQEHHHRPKKSVEIREDEIHDGEPSSGRRSLDGLKKRIGSLRRKKD